MVIMGVPSSAQIKQDGRGWGQTLDIFFEFWDPRRCLPHHDKFGDGSLVRQILTCDGDSPWVNAIFDPALGIGFLVLGMVVRPCLQDGLSQILYPDCSLSVSVGCGERLFVCLLGMIVNVWHQYVVIGRSQDPSTIDLWHVSVGLVLGSTAISCCRCAQRVCLKCKNASTNCFSKCKNVSTNCFSKCRNVSTNCFSKCRTCKQGKYQAVEGDHSVCVTRRCLSGQSVELEREKVARQQSRTRHAEVTSALEKRHAEVKSALEKRNEETKRQRNELQLQATQLQNRLFMELGDKDNTEALAGLVLNINGRRATYTQFEYNRVRKNRHQVRYADDATPQTEWVLMDDISVESVTYERWQCNVGGEQALWMDYDNKINEILTKAHEANKVARFVRGTQSLQKYYVDFSKEPPFQQVNTRTKVKRDIRMEKVPNNREHKEGLRVQKTELDPGCKPWADIQARVQESLPRHEVTKLEQINNNQLRMDFERQKEIIAAKSTNAARALEEDEQANVRLAFHAMAGGPDELKKIYEGGRENGGFDNRLGRTGAYGRGSYFAKHAIYSAYLYPCPTKAVDGSIVLLVAEVILGQSKDLGQLCSRDLQPWDPLGKARICDLVREPPIEGGAKGEVYDSVQGTEGSFGIHGPPGLHHPREDARKYGGNPEGEEEYGRQYIVYDKAKAYPRFLVTIRPK